ncbi:MAG: hypothetical protein KH269_05355 [Faecalibacterium prausnitzii]|nr:hypothetical protein [Faecalibacterium prausnitzii]
MISVICSYTNETMMNDVLLNSINKQTSYDYELVLIDSKKMNFSSAAETLNYGVSISKGQILLFVHQDVELLDPTIFDKISIFSQEYQFGMGCVAGVLENGAIYSSVIHGSNREQVGEKVENPMKVASCDECMFFIKKEQFKGFSDLGDTWHFYAVEYAMQCKLSNELVMLFPLNIYHLSPGWSRNDSYWVTLGVLAKKYKGKINKIPTTLAVFNIDRFTGFFVIYKRIKNAIKYVIEKRY